jgi:hypothetical protein
MFELDAREAKGLRSQSVISNRRGGRRYRPSPSRNRAWPCCRRYFGVRGAIRVNIEIIRAFVRLAPDARLDTELAGDWRHWNENTTAVHDGISTAIRELMLPSVRPRRAIGFRRPEPTRRRT